MEPLRDIPIVGTIVAMAADILVLSGWLWSIILSSIGEIFTLLALSSAYVAPEVGVLPQDFLQGLTFAAAILFFLTIAVSLVRQFASALNGGPES